jgi:hypothetical protein
VRRLHGPLRTMWRHGFRFLFVLDAAGLFGAMVLMNLARFGTDWPTCSSSFYLVGFLAATEIHLVINYFYGLSSGKNAPRPDRAWAKLGLAKPRSTCVQRFARRHEGKGAVMAERAQALDGQPVGVRSGSLHFTAPSARSAS